MRIPTSVLVPVPLQDVGHASTAAGFEHLQVAVLATGRDTRWGSVEDPERFGWSDRQVDASYPSSRHAGSARSVFYRDHYLKGVGRTPLWLDAQQGCADLQHGSGHLFPSSAAREYLVTAYCEARGIAQGMVPCVAVLARELEPGLARAIGDEEARRRAAGLPHLCDADRKLRAISVKPAGFARWSNIHQALILTASHPAALLESLTDLTAALGVPLESSDRIDLDEVGGAIERGLDHLVDHLGCFFGAGVLWGSLNNNFSIDGRCVDIEVSTVCCGPLMVRSATRRDGYESVGMLTGTELIVLVDEIRRSFRAIASQFQRLRWCAREPRSRRVLDSIGRFLAKRFGKGFWLWRESEVVRRLQKILDGRVDRRVASLLYRHELSHRPRPLQIPSTPMPVAAIGSEPWCRPGVLEAVGLVTDLERHADDTGFYNDCIRAVEAETSAEGFVRALGVARSAILSRFARP